MAAVDILLTMTGALIPLPTNGWADECMSLVRVDGWMDGCAKPLLTLDHTTTSFYMLSGFVNLAVLECKSHQTL